MRRMHAQADVSGVGQALLLLDAVRAPQSRPVFGREGNKAKRAPEEIGRDVLEKVLDRLTEAEA